MAAPDVEGAAGLGYLGDGALRAGMTVRNYGIYVDNINAVTATPFADNVLQALPTKVSLKHHTNLFFRGYDQENADFYLFKEWEREFDQYAAQGKLPNWSFVRFPHDYFGNFGTAKFGVNTPDTQMANNDYALGLLVEKVANSRFRDNTLVVVVKDDAQTGPTTWMPTVASFFSRGTICEARWCGHNKTFHHGERGAYHSKRAGHHAARYHRWSGTAHDGSV